MKKLTPLSQGGASLTLGFGMEPRCGSREYSLTSGETGSNEEDTYQIELLLVAQERGPLLLSHAPKGEVLAIWVPWLALSRRGMGRHGRTRTEWSGSMLFRKTLPKGQKTKKTS